MISIIVIIWKKDKTLLKKKNTFSRGFIRRVLLNYIKKYHFFIGPFNHFYLQELETYTSSVFKGKS